MLDCLRFSDLLVIRHRLVVYCFVPQLVLSLLLISSVGFGQKTQVKTTDGSTNVVSYCDLIRSPTNYEGKDVTVRASYRYGYEWQELFCLNCLDLGKMWLEFSDDLTKDSKRRLNILPKHQGTMNATFSGIFHSGTYGDGSYRFQLTVKSITEVKLVSRTGWDPNLLPPDKRKKLCGSEEASH